MSNTGNTPEGRVGWFARQFDALVGNIELVIQGKTNVIRLVLLGLLSEGHLLIEDVPGVGKTSLAKAIAGSIDASWHRIQFTPDLLPSDITGTSIFDPSTRTFEFHPGPIFANVVVADEINRASPKTQSALLEVMEERQVTVDSKAYPVPRPFIVIATQNPIDLDGTYELPEAQLDRFLMRSAVGYPALESEVEILARHGAPRVMKVSPIMTANDVRAMITVANEVYVDPAIQQYIARVTASTRSLPGVRLGVSPRGSLALLRASRARAASEGRAFVTPEDVKALAPSVLAHRLILTAEAQLQARSQDVALAEAVSGVAVPQALPGS